MNTVYPAAVKAVVVVCSLLAAWGALLFVEFQKRTQRQASDPFKVAGQMTRLAGVRAALPESAVVGYVTETEPGSVLQQAMFNSARYNLAPRMLVPGADSAVVLGNFSAPTDYAAFGAQRGLSVAKDFGEGVVLFQKGGR